MMVGASVGMLAAGITTPLDVVKSRMMVGTAAGRPVASVIKDIVKEVRLFRLLCRAGIRASAKGLGAGRHRRVGDAGREATGGTCADPCADAASILARSIHCPKSARRRRLLFFVLVRESDKPFATQGGAAGLFTGWRQRVGYLGLSNGIFFIMYEFCRGVLTDAPVIQIGS